MIQLLEAAKQAREALADDNVFRAEQILTAAIAQHDKQAGSAEPVAFLMVNHDQDIDDEDQTLVCFRKEQTEGYATDGYEITPLYTRPTPNAVAEGWKLVPESALKWLFGEEGEFECPPNLYFRGKPPAYWWRSVFRAMLASAPETTK